METVQQQELITLRPGLQRQTKPRHRLTESKRLEHTIRQLHVKELFRVIHPTKHAHFMAYMEHFSKTNHILGQKTRYRNFEVTKNCHLKAQ